MSTNPNQGQQPDPSADKYGGYTGYTPPKPADDPYGAYSQPVTPQQPASAGYQGSDPNYLYGQQGQQTYAGQQQQQQQGAYIPPQSVSGRGRAGGQGSSGPYDATSLKMNARLEALLSYLFICFSGVVFFFLERKNRFVRFHAAQSIVLFGPVFAVYALLQIIISLTSHIIILGALVNTLFGCVSSVIAIVFGLLWVFLMIQSYRGVNVKLPYVGAYAENLLRRFSKKGTV